MFVYDKPLDKKILFDIPISYQCNYYEVSIADYIIIIKVFPNKDFVIQFINSKNGEVEKIISNVELNFVQSEFPNLYYYQLDLGNDLKEIKKTE